MNPDNKNLLSIKPKPQDSAARIKFKKELPEVVKLIESLSKHVVGHPRVIEQIARIMRLYHAGLKRTFAPAGAFLLVGQTGGGKTHIAECFSRVWLGAEENDPPPLTRIECAGLSERHQITTLIGGAAEYMGYDNEPLLYQQNIDQHHYKIKVRAPWAELQPKLKDMSQDERSETIADFYNQHKPYRSVILFDEIEKAHAQVFRVLLHILDKGRYQMKNPQYGITDFTNTVLFMTSNIAEKEIQAELFEAQGTSGRIGFSPADLRKSMDKKTLEKVIRERVFKAMKRDPERFSPPFLGRIRRGVLVFCPFSDSELREIVKLELANLAKAILAGGNAPFPKINLSFTQDFVDFIFEVGISKEYGARPLKDAIDEHLLNPLAGLSLGLSNGDEILADVEGCETTFHFIGAVQIKAQAASNDLLVDWSEFIDENKDTTAPSPPLSTKHPKKP